MSSIHLALTILVIVLFTAAADGSPRASSTVSAAPIRNCSAMKEMATGSST